MTPNQYLWAQARDRLVAAVTGSGYSAELAELMARELGSPKAIDRMTSYIRQARPRTEEMLVDKMLAIKGEIDAWRAKKEAEEAQASYNARLYYKKWETDEEELNHEEVHPEGKAGQEGPQAARQRAAHHLGVLPGDEKGGK